MSRFDFHSPMTEVTGCCPDWNTNDFWLSGIYEYIDGGEYVNIYCPHCGREQRINIPQESWTIERERLARFERERLDNSTRQAVDEIIDDEEMNDLNEHENDISTDTPKMTIAEIITRLPDGWVIVSQSHFDGIVERKNDNYVKLSRLERRVQGYRGILLESIRRLGQTSGDTHRDKDASVLAVIASLAGLLSDIENRDTQHMDDIPF